MKGGEIMKAAEYNTIIPQNINRIIEEKGFKQGAVAEKAGFSQRELSDMLNGRRIIKALDILKISKTLGVTPNKLFGFDDPSQKTA